MDRMKTLEEELREASCIGDIEAVQDILGAGINVNAKHEINGWTPLHWAAKRGHKAIVNLLLVHGADPTVITNKNETPAALCTVPEICQLLEPGVSTVPSQPTSLPITPHYLKHPPLDGMSSRKSSALDHPMTTTTLPVNKTNQQCNGTSSNEEIVLKVRLANTGDPDFIEIEFPRKDLTYSRLLRVCCEELGVSATQVVRIRKLPDTLIRKDKDVQRFKDFQEIEVVVASAAGKNKLIPGSNGLIHVPGLGGSTVNGYQSISLYKNQTILY
ncbi:ankyrin repeat domain-containing protein 40 [Anabrus simplex]|uniref:ankyrin repeat domain-containing protein 40 n=1 Tax=Anabrus simplex TaxID=316456 RepID=UPI0034DCCAB8